jgi:hypothetical protein
MYYIIITIIDHRITTTITIPTQNSPPLSSSKNFFHANLFRFNEGVGYPPANLSHLRGENFVFSKNPTSPRKFV